MVFHKQPAATHPFLSKRKEVMSKTIEPETPRMIGSERGLEPGQTVKLVAQWQSGPQTLAGYEQPKLRLVLASPSGCEATHLMPNKIMKGDPRYAIR